jgi:hypothetical protein
MKLKIHIKYSKVMICQNGGKMSSKSWLWGETLALGRP